MQKRLLFSLIATLCLHTPQALKAYLIRNNSGYDIEVHLDFGKGGMGNLGTVCDHNFISCTTLTSNGYRLQRIIILANTSGTLEEKGYAHLPSRTDEQLKSDKITVEIGREFRYKIIDNTLAVATESKEAHAKSVEAALETTSISAVPLEAEQEQTKVSKVEVKAEEIKAQSEAARVQIEREKERTKELITAVTALKIKVENKS